MKQFNLLVIDDDESWCRLLVKFFSSRGYSVATAATCADGVVSANLRHPDCIVLDFHLTDGNAVDVCRSLKANGTAVLPPIMILSSDPDAETAVYGECPAARFLLKLTPLSELLMTVKSLIAARAENRSIITSSAHI